MAVEVRTYDKPIVVTLPVDTAIHADNDLLCNPVEIPNAVEPNGVALVQDVTLIDYDDQGVTVDLVFFGQYPGNLGVLNAAMAISDEQAAMVQGFVTVNTWLDVGAQQIGQEQPAGPVVRPTDGTTSIWVAAQTGGTPTYPTGHLTAKFGLLRG